ncbi:MAG: carbon-nitrogen hydrolase family protein [Candidatus Brocadiaceae bacterium]|nr:carbon-nitrogen hydrolase family protein [Candidatus Brocadiaceae bacterium]
MTKDDKITIAAIQMCSRQNRDENLATVRVLLEEAAQRGAQIIALPENFSYVGYESEMITVAEDPDTSSIIRFLTSFASKHKVAIIGGSIPLKNSGISKVTNTCLVINHEGRIVARYDKLHLFDVRLDDRTMITESRYVEAGSRVVTADLFGLKVGLSICYDLRFPELYRALVMQGANIIFVPAAFTMQTGNDHWEVLLRARAIENQCYIVAPAQIGQHNADRISYGRALIVDPWGQVMTQCQDKEGVIVSEIDLDFLEKVRNRLPCLAHIRRDKFFPPVALG